MSTATVITTSTMLLGWTAACGPDPDAPEPTEPVVPEAGATTGGEGEGR